MAEPIIEAVGLAKRFGKVEALAGLDLIAHGGQVTAVLGPNGAGKTTFIRTIATLIRPDAGSLRVTGIDVARHPEQVRRLIGPAGQYAAVTRVGVIDATGRMGKVFYGAVLADPEVELVAAVPPSQVDTSVGAVAGQPDSGVTIPDRLDVLSDVATQVALGLPGLPLGRCRDGPRALVPCEPRARGSWYIHSPPTASELTTQDTSEAPPLTAEAGLDRMACRGPWVPASSDGE
jgi:hypothetical protein